MLNNRSIIHINGKRKGGISDKETGRPLIIPGRLSGKKEQIIIHFWVIYNKDVQKLTTGEKDA